MNWKILIIGFLIFIIFGYLYNCKPYEFKKKPIHGLFCNLFLGYLLLSAGFIHSTGLMIPILKIKFLMFAFPYLLLLLAVKILVDIPDINGDNESERKSFVIKYGIKKTVLFSTVLVSLSLFISILNNDPLSSTALITIFPFFLYALFRGLEKDIMRAIRYPIAIINSSFGENESRMWVIIALFLTGNKDLLIFSPYFPILVPFPAVRMQIFMN